MSPYLRPARTLIALCCVALGTAALHAAPDEDALGKARGYPVAPRGTMAMDEAYRVGSFSALDSLGPHCSLPPSPQPLPLARAATEPALQYRFNGRLHSLDDYLQHQRATALLVLKDGEIVAERYQYERQPAQRMLSNSMAKTIVALAVGKALEEGRIRSLDDTAASYEKGLAGTLYGETRLVDLLRMSSGARFVEDYSGKDDFARFNQAMSGRGSLAAARTVTERLHPAGEVFNYGSAETQMLALAVRAATGQGLCAYVAEKI